MDIIQLLPTHIANQIAAGEVIQRPASAVKEILENALDAGSTEIKVSVKDAGKTLMKTIFGLLKPTSGAIEFIIDNKMSEIQSYDTENLIKIE